MSRRSEEEGRGTSWNLKPVVDCLDILVYYGIWSVYWYITDNSWNFNLPWYQLEVKCKCWEQLRIAILAMLRRARCFQRWQILQAPRRPESSRGARRRFEEALREEEWEAGAEPRPAASRFRLTGFGMGKRPESHGFCNVYNLMFPYWMATVVPHSQTHAFCSCVLPLGKLESAPAVCSAWFGLLAVASADLEHVGFTYALFISPSCLKASLQVPLLVQVLPWPFGWYVWGLFTSKRRSLHEKGW